MEEDTPMSSLCFTQAIIVCMQMISQILRQGAAKVLPFHIALTLNKRVWNLSDLGLIMMFLNFGKILNCIILTCVTRTGSKIVLVVHHYFVIAISVIGFCILGSAELGLVPDSQLVLTYVFGSLAMGTGYEEVLNLQVLISNFITEKVTHQATITSWMMTMDPVGYFALYAGSAVILEQSGYIAVLAMTTALGLISAVLLTVNLLLFWKNNNAERLHEQSPTPGPDQQATNLKAPNAEKTNKDRREPPEATLSNIWAEMTPSMYLLQLLIVILYATFNYSFVLVPYILLSQLNVNVAFLGYAASIANLISLLVARGFAWLDWNYPYEVLVHYFVMYLGTLAVPINFNVPSIALVGFCMLNTGMTNAYIAEPKIRVLLSPTWALTRVVGLIGLSRQPLKPIAAVLAPAMLTWSPAGASSIYTVCAGINIVAILYVFFTRSAMLTRKLYVPELDQKNGGKSLTPSEINALIEKRRKIIYLSYAEMEQMNYTGKTFDIPDDVAEEICSTVQEQKATDLFEIIQNKTASAMDQGMVDRLGTAVTLGETLREIDIGYTTKTVDLASINPAISTAAESSEFFSTAYAVRRLGQITSSAAVQTTEGTFVPPFFSHTGGTIPSLVGSLFTQDVENFTTLARQLSSVRVQGIREDQEGDE